ncbi:MAG: gliding motility-associated C-terminal domain-containing protein [Cyclobacteriaceae bacterium]|nr:gliding motility-associated C-terminal domain-containing protein [Cyclobacteriaceae bacterium]
MRNIGISLCFVLFIVSAKGQIISTFDSDADGWTGIDNLTGSNPTYQSNGGNPGGYIEVVDGVQGTATYFNAPAKFLGNRSSSYGATLRFDLQVSITPNSSTAGVRLIGGGITLVKLLPDLPAVAPAWTSYTFKLDESEDWKIINTYGNIADAEDIKTVLGSLTAIGINGEYSTVADDGGGLDNVVLETTVVPDIEVYNGISPNNDSKNDSFKILNIDLSPDTQNNNVTIYNRWGDLVFETVNYDNTKNVFKGLNSSGDRLPSGIYFYKIEFASARESITGYLTLKH